MMAFQSLAIQEGVTIPILVEQQARRAIARNAYISKKSKTKNKFYFEFGLTIPKIIIDNEDAPLIRNVSIDNVFSASVIESKKLLEIEWPDRASIHKKFQDKKSSLVRSAENALIDSMGSKLIDIPKVQNGLNPIKEILLALIELGEIPVSELRKRKGKNRSQQYMQFLEELHFITVDNNTVYPGNEISKYSLAELSAPEINASILNDVLTKGFRFLSEDLKIYILTPYLELTNAYYLQSLYADKLLHLRYNEISRHYSEMYKRAKKKPDYQNLANLVEMRHAHIIQGKHGVFHGYDELFEGFLERMPTIA